MELLELYADIYVEAAYLLGMMSHYKREPITEEHAQVCHRILSKLSGACQVAGLRVTLDKLDQLILFLEKPEWWSNAQTTQVAIDMGFEIVSRLQSELSHRVFFQIPQDRSELFNEPTKGWKEVIERFPDTITDIEECGRCFALSRYAASVFHSVQVVEVGLIHLGAFLQVKDPLSGWTAVTQELNRIMKMKYPDRTQFEKDNKEFIEQMQGCIEALKNAWRNKISHAHRRLTLMTSDFVPDVAEEIRMATRAFMRRLATEMPRNEAES